MLPVGTCPVGITIGISAIISINNNIITFLYDLDFDCHNNGIFLIVACGVQIS
jgi:hypothetical protein